MSGVAPVDVSAILTHHWLVRVRGGEKVLLALAELLPKAPLYTLVFDPALVRHDADDRRAVVDHGGRLGPGHFAQAGVHGSLLQRIPGGVRYYPRLFPLMPLAARRLHLPPADLVVCSDAALAKAMTPERRSRVVCYCHSPMRYVWEDEIREQYAASLPAPLRPMFRAACRRVRHTDYEAAQRVDRFVANSRHVADRIRRHYGRHADVVHPPVELPDAPRGGQHDGFYLCLGHHVPYKRLDLALAACRKLDRRLVVIGDGPDVQRLKRSGARNVTWLGWQAQTVIEKHLRAARALLFPGEEDFGIVPVEAMARGCPVVAFGVGGARETVVDGVTGVLFERQDVDALAAAMERVEALSFDAAAMHLAMQRFGHERFLREMRALLLDTAE